LLIGRTHQAGGLVHIWAWGDHQRSQTPKSLKGGIGGEVDRRLQRYIAARLGPIPGWSMGYGFDLDEWVTADQVKAWRDSMHQTMGWSHFLGGRPEGPNHGTDHTSNAAWNQGLDYSSYEHHRPTYEVYRAALEAIPDQPVMSEDRFRIRKGGYPEKDYTEELVRRGLYDSTLAGGVANIWGIDPGLSPGGVFPNKDQIKTYSVFFNDKGRFVADMIVANQLSGDGDTRVLLSGGSKSLVLYRESTSVMHVDLAGMPGPLPAVAVDTRKVYSEIQLGDLPAKPQSIQLPVDSDWIVAVGHFQPSAKNREDRSTNTAKLSFTDFDGDGDIDVLGANRTGPVNILRNDGRGNITLTDPASIGLDHAAEDGVTSANVDNDGDLDLLLGGSDGQGQLYLNDGRGKLEAEWLSPGTGKITTSSTVAGGAKQAFTEPFSGDAVLHLQPATKAAP